MTEVDYAHTREAERNRDAKTRAIATLAWRYAVTPAELDALDDAARRHLARAADVNPPSAGSPTWTQVRELLTRMHAAAGSEQAPPQDLKGERPAWLDDPAAPLPVEDADAAAHTPKGWDVLVATVDPLPNAPCSTCRAPSVVQTVSARHCAAHPPQPGEWGAHLDFTPRTVPCLTSRCYCGRCPHYTLAPPTTVPAPEPARRRR